MYRPLIAAILSATSVAGSAADRTTGVGSFDRLRVDGAFDVRITTGGSPRAALSGDARAIDLVDLRVEGTTLYVRRRSVDSDAVRLAASPIVVTLSAQRLASAAMLGSGRLVVTSMRGERADLSVAGTGTIAVTGVAVEQANVSIVGGGSITLAGRAAHARLSTNGPGAIDASALVVDDLVVRLDGPGETKANARYVATVSTTGLGRVDVSGNAKCTVRAPAGGAVTCGAR